MYAGHLNLTRALVWEVKASRPWPSAAPSSSALREGPWLDATVNSAEGRVVATTLRDNTLALVRDDLLATNLAARLRAHVPATMCVEHPKRGRVRLGLRGTLRAAPESTATSPDSTSGCTTTNPMCGTTPVPQLAHLMLYLNDDFEGGRTPGSRADERGRARTGNALLFQHAILHAGERVVRGTKYVLRSDVLYRIREGESQRPHTTT